MRNKLRVTRKVRRHNLEEGLIRLLGSNSESDRSHWSNRSDSRDLVSGAEGKSDLVSDSLPSFLSSHSHPDEISDQPKIIPLNPLTECCVRSRISSRSNRRRG
jgi:hypothetical protein